MCGDRGTNWVGIWVGEQQEKIRLRLRIWMLFVFKCAKCARKTVRIGISAAPMMLACCTGSRAVKCVRSPESNL